MKKIILLCSCILLGFTGFAQVVIMHDTLWGSGGPDTLFVIRTNDSLECKVRDVEDLSIRFSGFQGISPYCSDSTDPTPTYVCVRQKTIAETGEFQFANLMQEVPCDGNESMNSFFKRQCTVSHTILVCRPKHSTESSSLPLKDGIYFLFDNKWQSFESIGWKIVLL